MKLLYITKNLPFEAGEAFVLEEILDHIDHGCEVWIAPLGGGRIVHDGARVLSERTIHIGLFSAKALMTTLKAFFIRPATVFSLLGVILTQSGWRLLPRNLAVFAKGLWLGEQVRRHEFDHIHVHWIAAPATMAMIAARMASVPFSITAHRYDIMQANLVPAKFLHARFVRAINRSGAKDLEALLDHKMQSPWVLPMGVHLPAIASMRREGKLTAMRMVIGARMIAVKGYDTLISAIAIANEAGRDIRLDIFGDGPLEAKLYRQASMMGVADRINFCGLVSHERLTQALADATYDLAVLPSRTLADGTKEGIPVFLMEAMASGLPVVTTSCGGIPELVDNDCGRVVPEGDARALALAFGELMDDGALRERLASSGREKVMEGHDMNRIGQQLRRKFGEDNKRDYDG